MCAAFPARALVLAVLSMPPPGVLVICFFGKRGRPLGDVRSPRVQCGSWVRNPEPTTLTAQRHTHML